MAAKKKADLKIIILGDYAVGKTSLIRRYTDGIFREREAPTLGAAFFLKQWGPYNVAIWDTAGDERYSGLSHFYCRNAGAAIMAFDLSNVSTFESLWARFGNILEAADADCLKVIVGTKADLIKSNRVERDVTFDEGRKLSLELNSHMDTSTLPYPPYFETSSLLDENIQEVFEYILQHCLPLSSDQKKKQNSADKNIVDLMETSGQNTSKKCC